MGAIGYLYDDGNHDDAADDDGDYCQLQHLIRTQKRDMQVQQRSVHFSFLPIFLIHDVLSVPEKADSDPFLSTLWCTLNLPHSLTLLISPHSITCFVHHTSTIVSY